MATKSIAIIGKRGRQEVKPLAEQLVAWAAEQGWSCYLDEELRSHKIPAAQSYRKRNQLCEGIDFLFVLGGDGTFLNAARAALGQPTTLIGINLGGLGFLTEISAQELSSILPQVIDGTLPTSQRHLLQATMLRQGKEMGRWHAMNDVVINKGALARIVSLSAYDRGQFITSYKSDGVIIATPTGSTAYSLSAGGPIVEPGVASFVVTPICPHVLTNRSLVLHSLSQLRLHLDDAGGTVYMSIDGQEGIEMMPGDEIMVGLHPQKITMVCSPTKSYYEILRTKLMWGKRER